MGCCVNETRTSSCRQRDTMPSLGAVRGKRGSHGHLQNCRVGIGLDPESSGRARQSARQRPGDDQPAETPYAARRDALRRAGGIPWPVARLPTGAPMIPVASPRVDAATCADGEPSAPRPGPFHASVWPATRETRGSVRPCPASSCVFMPTCPSRLPERGQGRRLAFAPAYAVSVLSLSPAAWLQVVELVAHVTPRHSLGLRTAAYGTVGANRPSSSGASSSCVPGHLGATLQTPASSLAQAHAPGHPLAPIRTRSGDTSTPPAPAIRARDMAHVKAKTETR